MPTSSLEIERLLAQDFLERHPEEAAEELERESADIAAELLEQVAPDIATEVFRRVTPATAVEILEKIDRRQGGELLRRLDPPQAGALLIGLKKQERDEMLGGLAPAEAEQLRELMLYPPGSAGRLMDPRITVFRAGARADEALARAAFHSADSQDPQPPRCGQRRTPMWRCAAPRGDSGGPRSDALFVDPKPADRDVGARHARRGCRDDGAPQAVEHSDCRL